MRWKLTAKHYLNVPGTKYERSEVTSTGRASRQSFDVPMYLDPDAEGDWTHRPNMNEPGMIVVAQGPSADARDIIFTGDPTPDMEPLDDEARERTAAMGWDRRKIIQGADFGENLVEMFLKQQAETQANRSNDDVDLKTALAEMTKAITMLAAHQAPPAGEALRRV